jgi:hypothetical protein
MDTSKFVRDADYYLPDGDLVILVEITLFRVRRKPSNVNAFNVLRRVFYLRKGSSTHSLSRFIDVSEDARSLHRRLCRRQPSRASRGHGRSSSVSLGRVVRTVGFSISSHSKFKKRLMQQPLFSSPDEPLTKLEAFSQEPGLDGLLTLAEIANKYHCSSTERRLVKIFHHHVMTSSTPDQERHSRHSQACSPCRNNTESRKYTTAPIEDLCPTNPRQKYPR